MWTKSSSIYRIWNKGNKKTRECKFGVEILCQNMTPTRITDPKTPIKIRRQHIILPPDRF